MAINSAPAFANAVATSPRIHRPGWHEEDLGTKLGTIWVHESGRAKVRASLRGWTATLDDLTLLNNTARGARVRRFRTPEAAMAAVEALLAQKGELR